MSRKLITRFGAADKQGGGLARVILAVLNCDFAARADLSGKYRE